MNIEHRLRRVYDPVPQELVRFYKSRKRLSEEEREWGVLDLEEACEYSEGLNEPNLGRPWGLFVVVGNESDPYCLASRGVCAGMVFSLQHDGDSRFVFASLADFVEAMGAAIRAGDSLDDWRDLPSVVHPNQPELKRVIRELCKFPSEETDHLKYPLVAMVDPSDTRFLLELAEDEDDYVRQASLENAEKALNETHRSLVEKLLNDRWPNARNLAAHLQSRLG